jgi:hypothetical protein
MDLSAEIAVSMDFHADWIALLRESLVSIGYPSVSEEDELSVCCMYFNATRRRIVPRPRRILISREFSCPPDYLPGLQLLENKVRSGQDLTPHLSRKILKLAYDDAMLNDWRIYHFHLGLTYDDRGLIQGTSYILLARVTNDEFYEIDVVEHKLWHHQRYVEILHSNWPSSIELWKCGDILGLSHTPNDEEVKTLRRGRVNYMLRTEDGTIYCPIGGGYATSAMSAEVVRRCLQARQLLIRMEKAVKEHGERILQQELRDGKTTCSSFHFRLVLRNDGAYAVDEQALMAFHLKERRHCGLLYGHLSLPLRLCEDERTEHGGDSSQAHLPRRLEGDCLD